MWGDVQKAFTTSSADSDYVMLPATLALGEKVVIRSAHDLPSLAGVYSS